MDEISGLLIAKALDGLSLRQLHLAQNIANANSIGFVPMQVTFEAALATAAKDSVESIKEVRPNVSTLSASGQNAELRIDLQLAESSKTAMRYGALIEMLDRQMSLTRMAITGGNG